MRQRKQSPSRSPLAALLITICVLAASCGGSADDAGPATTTSDGRTASPTVTEPSLAATTAPLTTAAPATTTTPTTTAAPPTTTTTPAPTTTAEPEVDNGFENADFDDPATNAALSVRAGSAFLMLSNVFITCLNDAVAADPSASSLITEMVDVERGEGLSPAAADLAATCMAEPGYVDDVRDSWIGSETDPSVVDCLTNLFDVEVDIEATSASLQIDATEADIGGTTMTGALTCSANDLLIEILSDSGLADITADESQCIGQAMADAQDAGETQFRTSDFLPCLSDASHNRLAEDTFRFEVRGTEGRCLNEAVASRSNPDSRVVGVDVILGAHLECGTLGRFVNDQNNDRFDDDIVDCINEQGAIAEPTDNAGLGEVVNGCLNG